jgi:cytochrome c
MNPAVERSCDAFVGGGPARGTRQETSMKSFFGTVGITAILTAAAALSSAAWASPELLRARNCTACHHPERKMIGPAYKVIAEKYASDEAGQKALADKIRAGGGGVWGPSPMPPQAQVTPEEATALVEYIMTLK